MRQCGSDHQASRAMMQQPLSYCVECKLNRHEYIEYHRQGALLFGIYFFFLTRVPHLLGLSPAEADDYLYGYVPQEWIAIMFVTLFGVSTSEYRLFPSFNNRQLTSPVVHIGQATYYRLWWLLPTAAACGIGEIIGWSGRLWSSISPTLDQPYLVQISTTVLSPTPLLAANFIILSRIVQELGTMYSLLTPQWYTAVFLPCDLIALVIQAIGGGLASAAGDLTAANRGAHIALGGIVFQFVVIIVFSTLGVNFYTRYLHDRPVRVDVVNRTPRGVFTMRLKIMLCALACSNTLLFIRSVYRIIELSTGWSGRIIQTEVYFNVLDGGMVVLAIYVMNIAHPGFLLQQRAAAKGEKLGADP
ncbi:RTA1-domain-containing protein [Mycena maculata]|uniref:RTA1-domain-containing protein n=1 Tax=Mycena maculata TaxID=230809 RepID=A0AAD7NYC2_9AGAR|nr:RTA1-domain-containing protein [Mycena maculata]